MSVNEPKVRRRIISLLILLLSLSGLISFALLTESDPHLSAMANPPGLLQVQGESGSSPVNIPIVDENTHDRQQAEPTIAIDPRNQDIIVAGAQDYRLRDSNQHRWHGYYRSTDGGQSWTTELLPGFPGDNSPDGMASPLHRSNTLSDPVLAFDRMGNVYSTGIAFNITNDVAQPGLVAFVAKYINDGADYFGFFFSSRRRHTRSDRDWSSDVCSSDLPEGHPAQARLGKEYLERRKALEHPGQDQLCNAYRGSQAKIGDPFQERPPDASHHLRSEERRVGKECRSRWSPYH